MLANRFLNYAKYMSQSSNPIVSYIWKCAESLYQGTLGSNFRDLYIKYFSNHNGFLIHTLDKMHGLRHKLIQDTIDIAKANMVSEILNIKEGSASLENFSTNELNSLLELASCD